MSTQADDATWRRILETTVDKAYDSVLITDAEYRIVYANPGFTRMTGYGQDEVQGRTPGLLQGPKTDPDVIARLHHNIEHGEVFEGQTVNYRKDGTPFDIEWKVAPVRDDQGRVTHYVTVQRDVSPAPTG